MAAHDQVELRITSAIGLKNINFRDNGMLRPYAVVWVEPETKCRTYADDGGGNPYSWDQKLYIPFTTPIADSTLHIEIRHDTALGDNIPPKLRDGEDTALIVGKAEIKLGILNEEIRVGRRMPVKRSYNLKRPSGIEHGGIEISIRFRNLGKVVNAVESDVEEEME